MKVQLSTSESGPGVFVSYTTVFEAGSWKFMEENEQFNDENSVLILPIKNVLQYLKGHLPTVFTQRYKRKYLVLLGTAELLINVV